MPSQGSELTTDHGSWLEMRSKREPVVFQGVQDNSSSKFSFPRECGVTCGMTASATWNGDNRMSLVSEEQNLAAKPVITADYCLSSIWIAKQIPADCTHLSDRAKAHVAVFTITLNESVHILVFGNKRLPECSLAVAITVLSYSQWYLLSCSWQPITYLRPHYHTILCVRSVISVGESCGSEIPDETRA